VAGRSRSPDRPVPAHQPVRCPREVAGVGALPVRRLRAAGAAGVSTAGRGIPCYRCPGKVGTTGHVVRVAGPLDAYIEAVIVARLSRPDAIDLLAPAAPEVDLPGLRAAANAARARLTEIAEMLGDGELTRAEAQIARTRATARLERTEAEIATATRPSPLAGLVDAPDPAMVWAGLDIGRRRAVLAELLTVTVLPAGRPGPRFDPDTVNIEWKAQRSGE
jgi:site-specific DNA recombinase